MEPGRSGVYLEQEVYSATPAKLRWMLIEHAEQLVARVSRMWELGEIEPALQWQIQVRDILAELLSGVQASGGSLGQQVADLYIFLIAHFSLAEQSRDQQRLGDIRRILRIENETWKKFCEQELRQQASPFSPSTGHSFANSGAQIPISQGGLPPVSPGSNGQLPYTGLNLSV